MTVRTNTEALHAYLDAQHTAQAMLRTVAAYLDGHQEGTSPDEIDWGHVGDIRHVIDQLERLVNQA
jgi:hypothetical protein